MHELLEISGSSGYGIINNKVLLAVFRFRNRHLTDSSPEMIHVAEILLHAQHECCHKRFQFHRSRIHGGSGHQETQHLGAELPVQKQTLLICIRLHDGSHLPSFAGIGVVGLSLIRLDLAAVFADLKALTDLFHTGNIQFFTDRIAFAEVDLPEYGLLYKFIAEREVFIIHAISAGNILVFIHIHQELLAVKYVRSVIALITDEALGVIHVGINHSHLQHIPDLPGIRPFGTSAARACCHMLTSLQRFRMRAIRAQPPSGRLSRCQIHLINRQFSAVHIKAVIRGELTDSSRSGPTVFIDHLFILPLTDHRHGRSRIIFLSVQHCLQDDSGLRESIVRKQTFIGKEVENIFLAKFLQDTDQGRLLAL